MRIQDIDHVQLPIPRDAENDAREFYVTILGFSDVEKPEALRDRGGVWLRSGDVELHLGVDPDVVRGRQHPALLVASLDECRAHLRRAGVPIHDETPLPDRERFSIRDPFGNRLEFVERVRSPGASDGRQEPRSSVAGAHGGVGSGGAAIGALLYRHR